MACGWAYLLTTNSNAVSGGRGARGTIDYGGGGASGGGRHSDRLGVKTYPGLDAVDERGAPWSGGSNCGSPGGNGGVRATNGNSGIVFLEVRGKFDGSGGMIDVSAAMAKTASRVPGLLSRPVYTVARAVAELVAAVHPAGRVDTLFFL